MLLAAQWMMEKDGKITNKKTKKDLCTGTCILPFYDETGHIKMDGKVMSLKEGKKEKGTEIIWETEKSDDGNDDHQHWKKSRPNENGYFTLQSKATKNLYLHSTKDGKITNGLADGPDEPDGTPPPPNTPRCK